MGKQLAILGLLLIGQLTVFGQQEFGVPEHMQKRVVPQFSYLGNPQQFAVPDSMNREGSWFKRKLIHEHFVSVEDSALFLFVDPMLDLTAGNSSVANNQFLINGRGVRAGVVIADKLEATAHLMENQASNLPEQWYLHPEKETVIYGLGRSKINDDTTSFDYAWATGTVHVKLKPWWQSTLAYGRLHVGAGYRNLLVSNQTVPFPYVKNLWTYKNWTYAHVLAKWNTLERAAATINIEAPFLTTQVRFDEFSYRISDWKISCLSGVAWKQTEPLEQLSQWVKNLPLMAAHHFVNDTSLNFFGMDVQYAFRKSMAYSQVLLNSRHGLKRLAIQVGLKGNWYWKKMAIQARAEYNYIPNQFYSGNSMSWSHQGYFAGYAAGSGNELMFDLSVNYKRFQAGLTPMLNPSSKALSVLNYMRGTISYIVNSKNGLMVFASASRWKNTYAAQQRLLFVIEENQNKPIDIINIGIRTSVFPMFQDY